ncbi:hypothetical protein ABZX39_15165 [Streptomyces collinus]|uniref:hypothetical protein n=1 Tax=Streptomyces collinus TaxID=42684 RepID=UPI0033A027B7
MADDRIWGTWLAILLGVLDELLDLVRAEEFLPAPRNEVASTDHARPVLVAGSGLVEAHALLALVFATVVLALLVLAADMSHGGLQRCLAGLFHVRAGGSPQRAVLVSHGRPLAARAVP